MAEPRTARYTDIVPAKKTLIGSKVVNAKNEDLGKIEDVVLDAGSGRIAYAVLSFGGFLGMGDHYVVVRPSAISFKAKDNEWHATMNANADQIRAAPEYKYSSKP